MGEGRKEGISEWGRECENFSIIMHIRRYIYIYGFCKKITSANP